MRDPVYVAEAQQADAQPQKLQPHVAGIGIGLAGCAAIVTGVALIAGAGWAFVATGAFGIVIAMTVLRGATIGG